MKPASFLRACVAAPAVCVIVLSTPIATMAQDVIGTAIVGGRKIEILSDNTWRFEDRLAEACYVLNARIQFCGRDAGWSPLQNAGPQIAAAFERKGREYAFFISEPAGAADGMTLQLLGDAVLQNVANGMGVPADQVPIFSVEDVPLYGRSARRIALQAKLQSVNFVFINTFWIEESEAGQVFTYTYGETMRDSDLALHTQVVGSLVFTK